MGLEQRENGVENTINKQEELHLQNEKNTQKINIAISKRYHLDGQSDVVDLAQKIESDRKVVDGEFYAAFNTVHMECKADLSSLKFDLLNDKFGGNAEVKSLYYELKNELGIDLFQTLKAYDDYICTHLAFPENGTITMTQYQLLIKNIQTIIVMEIAKLNKKLLEYRQDNNGSLIGMQWVINNTISESLQPVRNSVMSSAQFFLEMQDIQMQNYLKDKIGSLHVNMRLRQIEEALIQKELIIHKKDGYFDSHEESDHWREIDKIPKDIIKNDSFWTADKTRNTYRDLALTNRDINADGSTIQQDLASLEHVSVLNDIDKQTEIDFMLSGIALELLLSLPILGTANSVINSVTPDDINIALIKQLRPELDVNYHVETTWGDRLLEIAAAGLGVVGLRSLAKSGKIAKFCETIAKSKGLNGVFESATVLQSEIFKTMAKMGGKLGINLDKIEPFFQVEQVVAKEKNVYDRSTPQIKSTQEMSDIWDASFSMNKNGMDNIDEIIKISKLNDFQRVNYLKVQFPELTQTQVQYVLQAHQMPGELFFHSTQEMIAKMKFLIKDAGIPPMTVKKLMDMGFAGKISEIIQNYTLDTKQLFENLSKFPEITPEHFGIVQNKKLLAGEILEPGTFFRDIKVDGKVFMTIHAANKNILDTVANNIKVVKNEQMDFMDIYDKYVKNDTTNFVEDTYKYNDIFKLHKILQGM